ncbi:MAG: hypothetical protein L6Q71_10200 [Planctomycetes bacterium]|nr:hypothetical protein [Planctomycetota bacterium]NUQ35098.1 hypothetical protein [Planctomycetaceae bacterium]
MVRKLLFGIGLACIPALTVIGQGNDPALEAYEASLKFPELSKRALAMNDFASSRDVRVIEKFRARYEKPESGQHAHPDEVRHLLAGALSLSRGADGFEGPSAAWLGALKPGADTWLKFQLMCNMTSTEACTGFLASLDAPKANVLDQAVAIEALGNAGDARLLSWIEKKFISPALDKEYESTILINACASALMRCRSLVKDPLYVKAAYVMIDLFALPKVSNTSKLVLARCLARALNTENWGADISQWRKALGEASGEKVDGGGGRTSSRRKPEFFGVVAHGDRICYVLDVSASMQALVSASEREQLEQEAKERDGPVTGGDKGDPDKKKEEKKEEGLPWDKIKNRFDLAVESLKLSIKGLEEHMKFAVVLFANKVETLNSTRQLIDASPANVTKVLKEIDQRMKLFMLDRGETEIHTGMRLAFRMHEKGQSKEHTQDTDVQAVLGGANAFYLLSDGAPTNDAFSHPAEDNANSGKQRGGPYKELEHFRRDLERLCFFRKPEIHCIGIATDTVEWLNMFADVGMGKVKLIGTATGAK